jgi:hypothetical protein
MTPMRSLRSESTADDDNKEHDQISGRFGQYNFIQDLPTSTGDRIS